MFNVKYIYIELLFKFSKNDCFFSNFSKICAFHQRFISMELLGQLRHLHRLPAQLVAVD